MKKTLILLFSTVVFLSTPLQSSAQITEPFYKKSIFVDDTTVVYISEARGLTRDSIILVPTFCWVDFLCCGGMYRGEYKGPTIGVGYDRIQQQVVDETVEEVYYNNIDLSVGYYFNNIDLAVDLEYQFSPTRSNFLETLPKRSDLGLSLWTNLFYQKTYSKYVSVPLLRAGLKSGYSSLMDSYYIEPKIALPFYLVEGHLYTSYQLQFQRVKSAVNSNIQFGIKLYIQDKHK